VETGAFSFCSPSRNPTSQMRNRRVVPDEGPGGVDGGRVDGGTGAFIR